MRTYQTLLTDYETLYRCGMCTKHHMHDGIVFINDEGVVGFEAIKFHNDGMDYRMLGYYPSPAEAYSSVMCYG